MSKKLSLTNGLLFLGLLSLSMPGFSFSIGGVEYQNVTECSAVNPHAACVKAAAQGKVTPAQQQRKNPSVLWGR